MQEDNKQDKPELTKEEYDAISKQSCAYVFGADSTTRVYNAYIYLCSLYNLSSTYPHEYQEAKAFFEKTIEGKEIIKWEKN